MLNVLLGLALLGACPATVVGRTSTEEAIVAMERRAMDGWLQGNPDGFIAISDPSITYFHSSVEKRLEGLDAVRQLYDGYRGKPLFDRYEIADTKVVVSAGTAILTYQLTTANGSLVRHWHATEIYQERQAGWRIVHSHFSQVAP